MACYLTDVGPVFVGTIDWSQGRTGCPNKHIKRPIHYARDDLSNQHMTGA
jgi:hypothetical protein